MLQRQFDRHDLRKLRIGRKLKDPWSGALITFRIVLQKDADQTEFIAKWNEHYPDAQVEYLPNTRLGIYGQDEGIWGQAMCYIFEDIFNTSVHCEGTYEPYSMSQGGSVYVPMWKFQPLTIPENFVQSIPRVEPEESLGIYW